MRVLFHIDEEASWGMLLEHVRNFLKEIPDAEITDIANGSAVNHYTQSEAIDNSLLNHVDFVACNNALRSNKIDLGTLDNRIRVVKAGVVEIATKQQTDYAYIRP
ncbi:hypothetical protein HZY86_07590 [Aerococcaceae bacterium DSM 111020]|nr:hypothetical protein [Aerococcaceae bacterium DSM 111020]